MEQLSRLNHKDLILWQKALDLAAFVHQACTVLPPSETYGLASQMRVACGSLAELETQLLLAQRVSYLRENEVTGLLARIEEIGRILHAVVAGLLRRQQ